MTRFAIARMDGRSNQQVIIDLVKDEAPGTLFEYPRLIAELSKGTDHQFSNETVARVVALANRRLLQEHQRRLQNVRSVGYRLAKASEHIVLASTDRRRAETKFKMGLQTLRNVRWEEMDENSRSAHQGQLMVMSAVWESVQSHERRLNRIEKAIRGRT